MNAQALYLNGQAILYGFDHRVGHLWLVATQHDGRTCVHFFFRSLHDCRKIPTYFAGLSQMARGYINYR